MDGFDLERRGEPLASRLLGNGSASIGADHLRRKAIISESLAWIGYAFIGRFEKRKSGGGSVFSSQESRSPPSER